LLIELDLGVANSLLMGWVCHCVPKRVETFPNILLICLEVQKKYNISLPNDKKKLKISTRFTYKSESIIEHFKKLFEQYTL
jgi:hypothetical protein